MIAALIRTVFAQPDADTARTQLRAVVDQLAPYAPTVAERLQAMETDVLAYTAFPAAHWSKIWSNNPIERLNRELKRRTDVVGIFPDKAIRDPPRRRPPRRDQRRDDRRRTPLHRRRLRRRPHRQHHRTSVARSTPNLTNSYRGTHVVTYTTRRDAIRSRGSQRALSRPMIVPDGRRQSQVPLRMCSKLSRSGVVAGPCVVAGLVAGVGRRRRTRRSEPLAGQDLPSRHGGLPSSRMLGRQRVIVKIEPLLVVRRTRRFAHDPRGTRHEPIPAAATHQTVVTSGLTASATWRPGDRTHANLVVPG